MKNSFSLFCFLHLLAYLCKGAEAEGLEVPKNLTEIANEVSAAAKEDWTPGIDTWEAPEDIKKAYPYYLMGYDFNHRPVIVWEAGKWDNKKIVENPDTKDLIYKHHEQFWYRCQNLKSPHPDAEEGVVLILDADQFSAAQLLSIETIKLQLHSLRTGEKIETIFSDIYFINLSFVGETWVNIIRPIAGRLVGRAETYGPNKEKWGPVLSAKIPKDQLAPWYTGNDDFKPVQVWG